MTEPGDWETYEENPDTPEEAARRLANDVHEWDERHGND